MGTVHHDDGHRCSCLPRHIDESVRSRHDDFHIQTNQLHGGPGPRLGGCPHRGDLKDEIPASDVAELAKAFFKGWEVRWRNGKEADAMNLWRRLPLSGERRNEDAPSHSDDERSPFHH